MKNPFKSKRNRTKWIPLGMFSFSGYDYVTFIRKNLKTGMLYFKTKRVNRHFLAVNCVNNVLPHNLINTQKVWDDITKQP